MNSSSTIGRTAEMRVVTKLMDLGWKVFEPVSSDLQYDLLVQDPGMYPFEFDRVQVKVAWKQPNGSIKLSMRYNDNDYNEDSFDYLAIVHESRIWLILWADVYPRYTITVGNGGEWDKYEITTR